MRTSLPCKSAPPQVWDLRIMIDKKQVWLQKKSGELRRKGCDYEHLGPGVWSTP